MIKNILRTALASIALAVAACGGGGGDEGGIGGTGAPMGTLRMSITDAPSCGYDAVNITVDRVRVNKNASAGDSDAGWVDIEVSPPARIDLLSLTNGILFTLGETPLETGTYTQMRLVLAANDIANPLANSVVPTGGAEVPLTTPSAQQSGLKSTVDIPVAQNQLADFVIDFDACKSVVTAGNSGKYLLKPVITVVPNFISGVQGYVEASLANGDTHVELEQDGVVVSSTVPDSTGQFLLEPVAPGTYDLVITAPGRATSVVTGVVVSSELVTQLDTAATPMTPPPASMGNVVGTVTTGVQPIDASVAITQQLSDGTPLEIDALPADSVTGAYAFALPVSAPYVAPYVAGGPLVFTADLGAAGLYGVTATSAGATKGDALPALTVGATLEADFVFP